MDPVIKPVENREFILGQFLSIVRFFIVVFRSAKEQKDGTAARVDWIGSDTRR